ncbi:MAG: hypothetical protein K5777_02100 [Nitrosopumilus sp.]|nr:hypothetical protein [Nitrosopumilus sp.]
MVFNEKIDPDFLAMSELTKEIGIIVQNSIDNGSEDLSPSDVEHILKITSDVTMKNKIRHCGINPVNLCNGRHTPVYKIKYKPLTLGGIQSQWFVCEKCFGRQEFFGQSEEIESIVHLKNHDNIMIDVNNLSAMTNTVTKKLRKLTVD